MTRPVRFDGRTGSGASEPVRRVATDRPRFWTQAEWAAWLRLRLRALGR